ncbi:MAG: hypothetical protein U9R44_02285 [Candidatus Omnitrophota bacterium]|nr:hypothetical protein [Candidatus Omnitrophota bacterium]
MKRRSGHITVDPENRLTVTDIFREVAGVTYEAAIEDSVGGKRLRKLLLDGKWSLTPEHDLKFRVSGTDSPFAGRTIILRGDVERVKGSGLTFRVRSCDAVSGTRSCTIELKGKWRADGNNRITFNVAGSRGRYDVLRFQGAWRLNRRNELIYRYTRTALRTRTRREKTLVFRGYWDLERRRIVYRIEGSNDSFFSFKAAIQSKSLRAADGSIKYQVGIKYSRRRVYRQRVQVVTIYGLWKLGKDLSVRFEVLCSGNKRRRITFQAEKMIGENGAVTVSLKTARGEKLGVEVRFSKAFSNDAELFVALGRQGRDVRIIGGVRVRL